MGAATIQAIAAVRETLTGMTRVDVAAGEQVLAAARVIGDSSPLRSALVDTTAEASDRAGLAQAVFAGYTPAARTLIQAAVEQRWSDGEDLLAGLEQIGFRALARTSDTASAIEGELFAFGQAVSSDSELELALSSKLGSPEAKAALVTALVGSASRPTQAILEHLVQQPRGRRIGEMLRAAASVVADQHDRLIATVTTATPLPAAQSTRLAQALTTQYGKDVLVQPVVDPAVLGGVRVAIGDDVIDGTIQSRLVDLRLQLAG